MKSLLRDILLVLAIIVLVMLAFQVNKINSTNYCDMCTEQFGMVCRPPQQTINITEFINGTSNVTITKWRERYDFLEQFGK